MAERSYRATQIDGEYIGILFFSVKNVIMNLSLFRLQFKNTFNHSLHCQIMLQCKTHHHRLPSGRVVVNGCVLSLKQGVTNPRTG